MCSTRVWASQTRTSTVPKAWCGRTDHHSWVNSTIEPVRTSGQHNIALFGAGHLGRAIASSDIFADHGFRVVAIFDTDPAKLGAQVGSTTVRHPDELVDAGVKIIFNYSESLLAVPPEVTVHTSSPAVDLLYALYFYLT